MVMVHRGQSVVHQAQVLVVLSPVWATEFLARTTSELPTGTVQAHRKALIMLAGTKAMLRQLVPICTKQAMTTKPLLSSSSNSSACHLAVK